MKTFIQLIVLLLFLAVVSGCAVNPVTGRNELALMSVSPQQEAAMGKKSFAQALQKMGGSYPDAALNSFVDQVGQRVARRSHRPEIKYSFAVVNDSAPNAFALPGGFIAISRGLLLNLENEAQLAAVLGHEIGHVTARHSVQGMQRSTLLGATVSILGAVAGDYGQMVSQIGGVTANLVDKRYSREQESESDQLGIDYMVQSGYAPQGAVELQEIFYRKIEGGGDSGWVGGLFRSHPFSKDRLDANRTYVSTRYASSRSAYGLDRSSYRQAIAPLLESEKAYALYDQARKLEIKGQVDAAIESYHKAMQQAPEHGLLLSALGMAYLRKEDVIPARRYLLKAINADGSYYQSRMGLGYVYLINKQAAQASAQLKKSLELMPTVQAAYLLGDAEHAQGHLVQARELFQAVARADAGGKLGQAALAKLERLGQ